MSTRNALAVPYFRVPVPYFSGTANRLFWAKPALQAQSVQCTNMYALIDTSIVPEVPYFLGNREVRDETSKIIAIILEFFSFYNFSLSRRKQGTSGTAVLFSRQAVLNG